MSRRESGFTIIELMVATLIFSVVLLLVTAGILQVSRMYYKGLTEASTQNAARSIIDSASQAIQFSGGTITETPGNTPGVNYAFCVGDKQFSYRLGAQVKDNPTGTDQTWHAIVEQNVSGSCASAAAQNLANQTVLGRDLMGKEMRLANLLVDDLGSNRYRVTVRVTYGDSDLLFSPSAPSDATGYSRADAACRPVRDGTQFCATSELSTVVVKRVQ
jgi:prepilin-type N-terminal cleavage/methylation domain-containing protein